MLWWMLLCALLVWQLLLAAWAVDQAANAARTASRVEARGGDAEKAARYARLRRRCAKGMKVEVDGRDGEGQRPHPDHRPRARPTSACAPRAARHFPS